MSNEEMPSFEDFTARLRDALADGGIAARNRIEAEAQRADDLMEFFWCYSALAAFGSDGLQCIVQSALNGSTVKSKSAALTLLVTLSVEGKLPNVNHRPFASPIAEMVNPRIDEGTIKLAARQMLRLLILSLPTDDLLLPVSQSLMHFTFSTPLLAAELASALGTKWLRFGPPLLDRYEQLLVEAAGDEPRFQAFFCDYPQLLDPMAVQVWSQPDFHGSLEADFIIRRADNTYLVVEIENPKKQLITSSNRLSREAGHAEAQALEYEDFLSNHPAEAKVHFPCYRRADCLAVVGLERSLSSTQRRALDRANGRKQNARIVGFDWLLDRARTIVGNVSEGHIEIVKRMRVI